MNNVQKAILAIRNIESTDELNQLIEAFKMQRTYIARNATRSLMIGDVVTFAGRGGRTITGSVEKINIKTVLVNSPTAGKWKVTASALTQVA